ncbi:tudor domain-containing 6-like isoform X2 [Acropora palmata]|uniref:tudor domain-containing 6-like isoform X2 n=1 Tax=Acropora palmata TaxID=6131 RepID=UPI003DA0055D
MSSLEAEDFFDIPADCTSSLAAIAECKERKPSWSSADAHLIPQDQREFLFLATNSKFSQAKPRDKFPSKLLTTMDLVPSDARVRSASDISSGLNRNPELEDLGTWNPMADDYESKAFNSYKEPTVADFVKSFPGNSSYSSPRGDDEVRIFVGRIPQQMTREGLNNLFSQVGKLVSCKLITQHSKDTNIGFVGYNTVGEAETAIQKFDGLDVGQGSRLKVALALTKQKPTFTDLEPTIDTVNGITENAESEQNEDETSLKNGLSASANSSVSCLDSSMIHEASSGPPEPGTPLQEIPSPLINHALNVRRPSSGSITQEPVSPSVIADPEQLSYVKGYKRFFIKQLSMESVPTDGSFEVVVTDVEHPGCVWAQLCTPEALERQEQLRTKLQVTYSSSAYENYVPTVGEVCVAQFSFDDNWYRAKVDIVNNVGTLRVTYIDFGNHEDVTVESVRRITEDLASFPRQALRLSLYGVASTSPSDNWSTEATSFVKSKALGSKCMIQVSRQHNEILFVQLHDPRETSFGATINESLIASGLAKPRERPVTSENMSQQYSAPEVPQKAESKRPEEKEGFQSKERRPVYQANPSQGQARQIKSPFQPGSNAAAPREFSNPVRNLTGTMANKEPFEVVINAIVNPWEFYAQKTDPELVHKLNNIMGDLNQYMNGNSFPPQSHAFSCGEWCAAKFSLDSLWYRAVILEILPNGFRVRYMDFGNSEVVSGNSIGPLPQHLQSFAPLSLRCSLAGVTKPKGKEWSAEAVYHFKSLVSNKTFLCRIIHQHDVTNIVELQDPSQNREQTVAGSLISVGLADAFVRKDGTKHQLTGKRGSSLTGPQQQLDGGTNEPKAVLNDSRKSPFNIQGSLPPNRSVGPASEVRTREAQYNQPNSGQRSQSDLTDKASWNKVAIIQQTSFHPRDKIEKRCLSQLESFVFQPAIKEATLPPEASFFNALLAEVTKEGLFFIQVADHEAAQSLKTLSEDMNAYYKSAESSFFRPQPNQLCAALFAETGDWCRAFIKDVTPDGSVDVHYVDFGNTETLPVSSAQLLLDRFINVPFFALPCSLAQISQPDPPGWSDQAMAFIAGKLPVFSCTNVHLVAKGCDMLHVDFVVSKDPPQSLSQLLLKEGLATRSLIRETGLAQQDSHIQGQVPLRRLSEQSARSTASSRKAADIVSCVFEPAVKALEGRDVFDAMLTHVSSPSSFFIQVLEHDNVKSLEQLSADLNAHYSSVRYPPFQAQTNKMCVGLFSETNDWCRGFIDGVNLDGTAHVHYLDYGNSEVLPCSEMRPLEARFQHLAPMALKSSLNGVFPAQSNGWSNSARESFLSIAPLNSQLKVRVIGSESGLLLVDAISPNSSSQVSLSQFLVNQGLASANPPLDQQMTPCPQAPFNDARFNASEVPLVNVPQGTTCRVLVSDVQRPDKLFLQVLHKENVQNLLAMSETLNMHCSTIDNVPYNPELGELCCAKFSDDQTWYRAVVKEKITESDMMVVFVDYGNQDVVSMDSIRRIRNSFAQLPIQAVECFLVDIEPVSGSIWSSDAATFLKQRLTAQVTEAFFAEFGTCRQGQSFGVKLFEVGPDRQPGKPVAEDMVKRGLARGPDDAAISVLPMIVPNLDQFDVVITDVVHPGEIWGQVLDPEANNALDMLMKDINEYCLREAVPVSTFLPGQECCAQFSQDSLWYRARVLGCPSSERIKVQFVDFGNSELSTPDKIRVMRDEFFKLPAQALKLCLANIRPTHHAWSQEAGAWLKVIVNRQLKATVIKRLPEHLVVSLSDWNVPNGPINISQELINAGYAANS